VGLEVARAVACAHQQGLIHRDIKPQNVLLNGEGRAKVTDFGIARSLDAVGHTETGTVLGTSHYIAPEQARGERVDAQTDVYSFGVVLYELLTGAVPYVGDNFLTVALRHVNDDVPAVLERRPDCPLRLAALVERCMAKDPAERPGSMEAVADELEATLAELDSRPDGEATMIVRSPVVKQSRPRPERSRRRVVPLLLTLLGVVAAAAVVGGLYLARGDGDGGKAAGGTAGAALKLTAPSSYDPQGDDGAEHPEAVQRATDGNPATYWTTSTYEDFAATKDGVGIVLDAGKKEAVRSVTVKSDTPGFTAELQSGESPDGPFETVGAGETIGATTTFALDDVTTRYLVVWITALDGRAHVNEVTARS
jgi:eukaryotic-like serine/threonine-protein kinase